MGSLFVLSTFPRALLISLLPVVTLRMLGSAEAVSIFYTLVSAAGIAASICIPTLGRTFGASGLVLLGAISMMACGVLFGRHIALVRGGHDFVSLWIRRDGDRTHAVCT